MRGRGTIGILLAAVILLVGVSGAFAAQGDEDAATDSHLVDDLPANGRQAEMQGYQNQLDDLTSQLKDLKQKQDAVKTQIAGARSEKEKKLVEKTHWEQQITLTQSEISLLEERIAVLEQQIEVKLQEIAAKQTDIDTSFEQYKKRIRASYMAGESSTLSMVLGAADFTDFLMRTEFVRATAEHDKALVETLRTQRKELEEAKAQLDESKSAVVSDEDSMQLKKKELETELSNTRGEIEDISQLEQEYLSRAAELAEMDKQMQAEMDEIYKKIDTSGEYVGGTFGWPLPGYQVITSYYGWRFNNTNFHTGIDISGSGVYGASVRASNSGTVAYVQTSYQNGVGYGKHVIVNHGGGFTTLYAHMSSISVSVGDTVTRGVSEIGKVGSTGWSTGPHLHFEVRVDSKTKNPLEYLKG